MSLKERLSLLVEKSGGGTQSELMVELIVQVERLGDLLDRGIVVFEGGDAENVEEETTPDPLGG